MLLAEQVLLLSATQAQFEHDAMGMCSSAKEVVTTIAEATIGHASQSDPQEVVCSLLEDSMKKHLLELKKSDCCCVSQLQLVLSHSISPYQRMSLYWRARQPTAAECQAPY